MNWLNNLSKDHEGPFAYATQQQIKSYFIQAPGNNIKNAADCANFAKTSATVCNPHTKQPCQYMSYSESEGVPSCYVGGSDLGLDEVEFNGSKKDGAPVFLTPIPGKDPIIERTKAAVKRNIANMRKQKATIESQLQSRKLYLKSLNENKDYDIVLKEHQENETNKLIAQKADELARINKRLTEMAQVVDGASKTQSTLLFEKDRILTEKENDLARNYRDLSKLEKDIMTISQEINTNNSLFDFNQRVYNTLYISSIVFVVVCIIVIIYYKYRSSIQL